jgi:copper chaperone
MAVKPPLYAAKVRSKQEMTKTYKVTGMSCGGCASSVTKAILSVAPKANISVDPSSGLAVVEGDSDEATVKAAIEAAGFGYAGMA